MKRKYIDIERLQNWQGSINLLENIFISENFHTEITFYQIM